MERREPTHPHAGLQADLGQDGPEGDAPLHSHRPGLLLSPGLQGADDLLRVGRLGEVDGAALIRRQGH